MGLRFWGKRENKTETPVISISLSQVKKAVRDYEATLPGGVNRTILVRDDNAIDFMLLLPFLPGLPDRPYYMSRETFEIFPEEEKEVPYWLDRVQQAVDDYIRERGEPPIVPWDPQRKVNYYLLVKHYYLKERPTLDLYLTAYENLISHRPPGRG